MESLLATEHSWATVDTVTASSSAMTGSLHRDFEVLRYGPYNEMLVSTTLVPHAFFAAENGHRASVIDLALQKMTHRVDAHRVLSVASVPKPQGMELYTTNELELTRPYCVTLHATELNQPHEHGPNQVLLPHAPSFEDDVGILKLWVSQMAHPRCDSLIAVLVEWSLTPQQVSRLDRRPEFVAASAELARRLSRFVADTVITTCWELVRGTAAPFLQADPYLFDPIMDSATMTALQASWALEQPMYVQAHRFHAKYVMARYTVGMLWAGQYDEMAAAGAWDSLTVHDEGAKGGVVPEGQVWTLRKAEWTGLLPPELRFQGPHRARPVRTVGVPFDAPPPVWQSEAQESGACLVGYLYIQTHRMPDGDDQRDVTADATDEFRSGLPCIIKVPAVIQIVPRTWVDVTRPLALNVTRQPCALNIQFVDARMHLRTLPELPDGHQAARVRMHASQRERLLGIASPTVFGRVQSCLGPAVMTRLCRDLATKVLAPMAWRVETMVTTLACAAAAFPLALVMDHSMATEQQTPVSHEIAVQRSALDIALHWMIPHPRAMAKPECLDARYGSATRPHVHALLGSLQHSMPRTATKVQSATNPFRAYYRAAA